MTREQIVQAIPIGEKNAIHLEALANNIGLATWKCKKEIQEARKQGADIISGTSGYWKPETDHERQVWADSMKKQALSRLSTSKKMRKYLKDTVDGQVTIDSYDTQEVQERTI